MDGKVSFSTAPVGRSVSILPAPAGPARVCSTLDELGRSGAAKEGDKREEFVRHCDEESVGRNTSKARLEM